MDKRVAVIGGSGLYLFDGMDDVREVEVKTPYGATSDVISIGRLAMWKLPLFQDTVVVTVSPRLKCPTGQTYGP